MRSPKRFVRLLLAISVVTFSHIAQAATERPNIIVLMVDDMGYAGPSASPYGNPNYSTPGMDRLINEGMAFTDFHSSGTVCSPTRAGLLTGRYQQRAGIEAVIHPYPQHPENPRGLRKSEITFAELFKEAGYATGIVGKWHLGYPENNPEFHPQNHGFDYFRGYHSGNIDYINHWGDHYEHDWWHGRDEVREPGYTTHLINKYALEFIDQNKEKPFCLYVAHEAPHAPIQGPNDPIQRGPGATPNKTPVDESMKQMILEMDTGVEQILNKIAELGLENKTFLVFLSDNGPAPATATQSPRWKGLKGSIYEGGHRVPALAWWPGKIKPGTVNNDLCISLDLMPTLLSIVGIQNPKHRPLDGIDLSPTLFKQEPIPDRPLYWAQLSNNGNRSEAMRDGKWKLVVKHPDAKEGTFENESIELYNLDRDPSESTDLATVHTDRRDQMLEQLKAWFADTQRDATPQPGGWIPSGMTASEANEGFKKFRDARQEAYAQPNPDPAFFDGIDLSGWSGNDGYWSVKDGTIIGHSEQNIPKNQFLWSDIEVGDFYLQVDVKLEPIGRNAGIQFRSRKINDYGQAQGYQADIGMNYWGMLYHEHGRKFLDNNENGLRSVKRGEWNRYEILAVGDRIWTALNGVLCVAIKDPEGEASGRIALQVHSGKPQTVHYRNPILVHNPKVTLVGYNEQELNARLVQPLDQQIQSPLE